MTKNRKFQILMSLALVAGILLAALPTAPAFALSAPTVTSIGTAISTTSSSACTVRVYVKDRHVTYEHRGKQTIVHVSEIVVTVHSNCTRTERHRSYTYVQR